METYGASLSFFASLLLIMTSIFFFVASVEYQRRKAAEGTKKLQVPLPPGPKPWPLVGCLPQMLTSKLPAFRWIHKLMVEMNTEIMCIRLGNVHVISVTSPEIAREFLKKQDAIFSSRPENMSSEVASGGFLSLALTPVGEQWKKMRRIMSSEVVSPARHRWLHDKRVEEADHTLGYVYNQCKGSNTGAGGVVNVRVASKHYCGNVMRKMMFGKRFWGDETKDGGPGAEEEEHIGAVLTIVQYLFAFCVSDYLPWLRGRLDLDGHEKIMRRAVKTVRKHQDPEVDARIEQWRDGKRDEQEDLLDVLVMLKDKDGSPLLTPEEIKGQMVEMMIAAVDNPSNAVEWALSEMLNQPEKFERAREELDRVVGKDRLVQESDLPELNYVKACVREAFRLHSVSPFNVARVSVQDTVVCGFFIPKGSHLLLSRTGLGRNPSAWGEDSLKFRPERHLKDDGSNVVLGDPDLRMITFSTGRRSCVGGALGSTMTFMLMARLLHGFTWDVPPNSTGVDLTEAVDNLSPAKPLLALAKPRLAHNLYPTA